MLGELPLAGALWRENRRRIGAWAALMALVSVGATLLVDTMARAGTLAEAGTALPAVVAEELGVGEGATAAGALSGGFFGVTASVLLTVFAIGLGARAIGAAAQTGELELFLAQPVTRTRLLVERVVALSLAVTVLAGFTAGGVAAVGAVTALDVPFDGVIVATLSAALVALGFGALSLLVGAVTGRADAAARVPAVTAAAAYTLHLVGTWVPGVAGLAWFSPFRHHIDPEPLLAGVTGHLVLLAVAPLLVVLAAVAAFDSRDVGLPGRLTGRRPRPPARSGPGAGG